MLTARLIIATAALSLAATAVAEPRKQTESSAAAVFQRLTELKGDWAGTSTKGWAGSLSIDVVAGGSVIVATSEFDAHVGDTMVTAYHLDGERLMLTHYCIAGNQPRLTTGGWDPDGAVTFRFHDGTGMASRDDGHMDKVRMQLTAKNRFTSRWTWYQDGEERWLEEIEYQRVEAP